MYAYPTREAPLTQGDIIDRCPLVHWIMQGEPASSHTSVVSQQRVLVLTQACDLATRVQLAVIHDSQMLVDEGLLKAQTIRDQVRRHRVFGWYFLPESDRFPESIVNLREIHTVPGQLVEQSIAAGHRLASLTTPFREHLAQHFVVTYGRIGLPHEYETQDD